MSKRTFGTIRRLPSGRHQARWMGPDGHIHKGPHTFETREAADLWLSRELVGRAEGSWIDERRASELFRDTAARWRKNLVGLRASTSVRDLDYLERYILPTFGPLELAQIDHDTVTAWVAELSAAGLSAATVTKAVQILSKILKVAVLEKRLGSNPCAGVKVPKDPNPVEMSIIDTDQIDQLADVIDQRWRGLVYLGCYCALRVGEMLALRVRDIDLKARRLTVTRTVTEVGGRHHIGQPKTRRGQRSVPMPRLVAAELASHLAGKHPDDLVFPNTLGDFQSLSGFRSRTWRPAVDQLKLGRNFRIHDMRHTAISMWIAEGFDVKKIAAWAGHASVVTVLDRYGHLMPEDDDPMGALDRRARDNRPRGGTVTPIR